jgi:arylsulfatase A-like enzyme
VQGNHAPEGGYSKLNHTNTLAVWLQRSGYSTIHLGKYLNDYGEKPNSPTEIPPGWTEWHGGIGLSYDGGTMNENGTVIRPGRGGGKYSTDLYSDRAVEIVKRRAQATRPFFLWVAYYAPHAGRPAEADDPPNFPTPAVADRHRDRFATLPPNRLPSFDAPTPTQSRKPLAPDEITQIDEVRRQRLESLLAVDEGVARVIAAIPAAERANTVVLFTSDNGFYLGERRIRFGKVYPYEEGLRVPLLVRGPGVPKGAHVKSLVANIDLAPTILAWARAKPGLPQDGKSLMPLFANPAALPKRAYLVESLVTKQTPEPILWGVRTQRYFYLQYRGSSTSELFDLAVDPYELVSHAKNPAYASVKNQLVAKLQALKTCSGASCAVSSP